MSKTFSRKGEKWKNSQEKTKEDAPEEKPSSDTTSEHEMFLKMKDTTSNGEHVGDQKLLIDLNSPGDGLKHDSASKSLVQINISYTDEMNEWNLLKEWITQFRIRSQIVAGISKEHEICCLWHKIVRAVVSVGNFNSRLKHLIYLQNMT